MACYVSALIICPILSVEGLLCTEQTWKMVSSFRSKCKHVFFSSNTTHGVTDILCLFCVFMWKLGLRELSLSLFFSLKHTHAHTHTHTHTARTPAIAVNKKLSFISKSGDCDFYQHL